jgi:hypothetical protein
MGKNRGFPLLLAVINEMTGKLFPHGRFTKIFCFLPTITWINRPLRQKNRGQDRKNREPVFKRLFSTLRPGGKLGFFFRLANPILPTS